MAKLGVRASVYGLLMLAAFFTNRARMVALPDAARVPSRRHTHLRAGAASRRLVSPSQKAPVEYQVAARPVRRIKYHRPSRPAHADVRPIRNRLVNDIRPVRVN